MLAILVGAVLILVAIGSYYVFFSKPAPVAEPIVVPEEVQQPAPRKNSIKKQNQSSHKAAVHHKRLIDSFKNLQSGVIDFDMKPGYLGLCCEDSSLRIYKIQSYTDTKAKYVQGALTRNQPSAVAINPAGNIMYVAGTQDLQIHMYKVQSHNSKLNLEQEKVFQQKHTIRISSIGYTPTCIISCGEEQDTFIYI